MYKKILISTIVSAFALLSLHSQLQIQALKKNQKQLESVKNEDVENKKTSEKTLLDQAMEDFREQEKVVTQRQEDQYTESSNSTNQSGSQTQFQQKCQEEQAEYNSCLIKYNTELLEYQNCQTGEKTFGCPLSSHQPYNACGLNISSWCRKQILGHY